MNKLLVALSITFTNSLLFLYTNGQDYFQQEVNYKIEVKLNDTKHYLSGFEEIVYINNSPDKLEFIYFHLWPNAYKNNETALAKQKFEFGRKIKLFRVEEQRGFIDSLDFKVDGKSIKWELDEVNIDICKLHLNQPLKQGNKIVVTTPFRVKIPKGNTSRLGHIDQSYTITQWYPKPAVFDKYGWHQMPYLNMGEFFSEFGSYDVSITVPENYFVAATGNLQNKDEIELIERKAEETAGIKKFDSQDHDFPPSEKKCKTLRFTEENIHDFAWFADKRFHILKGEVKLPHSGKKVNTLAYFPNRDADLWKNSIEYINDAIYYYSLWYGDYPYNNCTAVNAPLSAGGGMEYPTITVISGSPTAMALEMVIMHEVGHNWFYGILGSNEREHTWMDEGINTFSEMRYFNTKYPDNKLYKMLLKKESQAKMLGVEDLNYPVMHHVNYLLNARRNLDQLIDLPVKEYSQTNYAAITYSKTGLSFYYLLDYLGEENFNKIMQDYYETWKFKHPYPKDFQDIVEKHIYADLSWFFVDLLQTTKKLDYKISKVRYNKVLIKNKEKIAGPVSVYGISNDSLVYKVWSSGFKGKKWLVLPKSESIESLQIDKSSKIPELRRHNNTSRTSGVFRKINPVEFNLLGIIDNPDKTQVNLLPSAGWNYYNKFMLGGFFYNSLLPQPKFEYQLVPMYSFGTNDFAGMGKIRYNIIPYSNMFKMISLFVSGMQFAYENENGRYFQKLKAGIDFRLHRKIMKKPVDNYLKLNYITATNMEDILSGQKNVYKQYYNIVYLHTNARKINPYNFSINVQASENFVKSFLEANYEYVYLYDKSLKIRLFGGAFLYKSNDLSDFYSYTVSGSTGNNDYTYDNLYLGRFEDAVGNNILSKQFAGSNGGFAVYSPFGQTSDWLMALNLSSSLPILIQKKIPLEVYANIATVGKTISIPDWDVSDSFLYEAGVKVNIIRGVFEFYFPLVMSDVLMDYSNEVTSNYWQKIRFTLYLNKMNPFELARKI